MFSFICRDFTLTDSPTPIGRQADRQTALAGNLPQQLKYPNVTSPKSILLKTLRPLLDIRIPLNRSGDPLTPRIIILVISFLVIIEQPKWLLVVSAHSAKQSTSLYLTASLVYWFVISISYNLYVGIVYRRHRCYCRRQADK